MQLVVSDIYEYLLNIYFQITLQLSEDVETKLTTGLFSSQKQFQTAPWIPLKLDRYVLVL